MISRHVLACMFVLLALPPARADEKAAAELAMAEANEHLQRREYDAAINRFRDALRLIPTASGPFLGLGLAFAATNRCDKAIDAFEEYLRRHPRDPKPVAKAELDACRVRQTAPGRLRVESAPPGAEVRLDRESGAPLGVTPFETASLAPGAHKVLLSHAGYKPHVGEVRIEPGMVAMVSVALEALATVFTVPAPPIRPPLDDSPLMPAFESGLVGSSPAGTSGTNESAASRPAPTAAHAPASAAPPALTFVPSGSAAPVAAASATEGRLLVLATAQPASIYVNGERVSSDGRAELRLPPGLYGVTVEREGYLGAAGSVPLLAGETKSFGAELHPLKSHGWTTLGVMFTLLALGSEAAAIAGHVLADHSINPGSDYSTWHAMEVYGQVGFGCGAGIATLGYVLDYVVNRGRVDDGTPFPLVPAERR